MDRLICFGTAEVKLQRALSLLVVSSAIRVERDIPFLTLRDM